MIEELCESLGQPAEQIAAALLADKFSLEQLAPPEERKKPRRERDRKNHSKHDHNNFDNNSFDNKRFEQDKPRRERSNKDSIPFEQYRIEAGTDHEVQAKDIVGALANEAGLERDYIGRIELNEQYSTVGLPPGMPKEVFQLLQKVRVKGQPMRISKIGAAKATGKKKKTSDDKPTAKRKPRTKPSAKSNLKKSAKKPIGKPKSKSSKKKKPKK